MNPGFYLRSAFIALACLFVLRAQAANPAPAPDVLVKQLSDEVVASIQQNGAIRAGDPAQVAALVETTVAPHFDFRRITQIAMGVNWRRATPGQQEQLTREFRALLVRTYSGALASYRGHVIEVRPLRAQPADDEVTVRSVVKQPGGEPIAIEYDLERSDAGWKIFDVRVAGISLVATYRSSFTEEVRNHGVEGLIDLLAGKNRQGGAKPVAFRP